MYCLLYYFTSKCCFHLRIISSHWSKTVVLNWWFEAPSGSWNRFQVASKPFIYYLSTEKEQKPYLTRLKRLLLAWFYYDYSF